MRENVRIKTLFVCSGNTDRSPTAVSVFSHADDIVARSAGILPSAPHPLASTDLEWADLVLVMEDEQREYIKKRWKRWFRERGKDVDVLNIPDRFQRGRKELVDLVKSTAGPIIEAHLCVEYGLQLSSTRALDLLETLDGGPLDETVLLALSRGHDFDRKKRDLRWLSRHRLVVTDEVQGSPLIGLTERGRAAMKVAKDFRALPL